MEEPAESLDTEDSVGATRPVRERAALALVGALYACVLLSKLNAPLWLDEAWTVEDLLGTRILHVGYQVRERAYEGLLSVWMQLAGVSGASLRVLMLGFGLATVWALVRAARRTGNPITAALVYTSFAVIPHFAIEINRYSELALGATLSLGACLTLGERFKRGPAVVLVLAGVGAFYMHHTAAVTVLSVTACALLVQALAASPEQRRARVAVCLGLPAIQLLLTLPEIPWLLERAEVYGAEQSTVYAHVYHGLTPASLLRFLRQLRPGGEAAPEALGWGALLVLAALVIDGARRPGPGRKTLFVFALGPLVAATLASFAQPMFEARVLIPALPAAALLASRALPNSPRLRCGLAATLALITWIGFVAQPWHEDVRPALASLRADGQRGDGLIVQPPFAWVTVRGNARVDRVPLAQFRELALEAPTAFQAARADYRAFPPQTFVVLHRFRGFSKALEAELPLRFRTVTTVASGRGFDLLRCTDPLTTEGVLQTGGSVNDEPAALTAFRAGSVLLHANRPTEALASFERARQELPTGRARDEREERDNRAQTAWAISWAAHRSGDPERARVALLEAEALGTSVPAELRKAILGR